MRSPICSPHNSAHFHPRTIEVGERVLIHETVTGYDYGEYGTVVEYADDRYYVRTRDGVLFTQIPDGVKKA